MKAMWIWIGCVAFFLIGIVFVVSRAAKTEPKVVLWSDLQYGDAGAQSDRGITEDLLRNTVIPEIDFDDDPFLDCVAFIETAINENMSGPRISLIVLEDAVNVPIKMKLTDAPVAEGLRYLTSMANLKYRVTNDGDVEMVSFLEKEGIEEGWFEPRSSFFLDELDTIEKQVDVRAFLERSGVNFPDGTVADFYPKRGLMWVRNTRDQLELIDAYISSACYLPAPTWRDHVYDYWILLTDGYPPAPSSPPVSVPPAPDPFGGGGLSGESEPDPFQ